MKEYRREKHTLEQQLANLNKKAASHDDHIRLIDAWFMQVSNHPTSLLNHSADQYLATR